MRVVMKLGHDIAVTAIPHKLQAQEFRESKPASAIHWLVNHFFLPQGLGLFVPLFIPALGLDDRALTDDLIHLHGEQALDNGIIAVQVAVDFPESVQARDVQVAIFRPRCSPAFFSGSAVVQRFIGRRKLSPQKCRLLKRHCHRASQVVQAGHDAS
jgi:hypothetical protein